MSIYYVILAILVCCYFFIYKIQLPFLQNKKLAFIIISGIILILFSAIRSDLVGSDLSVYLEIFKSTKNLTIFEIITNGLSLDHFLSTEIYNGIYETGYVLFNKIIYTFSDTSFALKLGTSLFINIPIMFFIYKYSRNALISILLYMLFGYYTQSLIIIRQYMALSMVILSLHYLMKDDKKFYTYVFIGFLFHKTAAVFLIVMIIKKNWNFIIKNIRWLLACIAILFIFGKPLLTFLIDNFYPFYSDKIISGEGITLLIFLTLIFGVSLYIAKINKYNFKSFNYMMIMFILAIIIQLFTVQFSLLNRLALYFQFFLIIYIPNFVHLKKYRHIINLCILSVFLLYFTYLLLNDSGQIRNYRISDSIELVAVIDMY